MALVFGAVILTAICARADNTETPPTVVTFTGDLVPVEIPTPAEQRTTERPALVSIDDAIRECLEHNLDVQGGREGIAHAKADLRTTSLLPNPDLTVDTALHPLPGQHFTEQKPGGPEQYDAIVSYPVDWLVFGKRAAAVESARRGIDVSVADFADLVRQRLADTIGAFYDTVEAKALLPLAEEDTGNLRRVAEMTAQRAAIGGGPRIDVDRARLAATASERDLRQADRAVVTTKATLRVLLGRTGDEPAFDVEGTVEVEHPSEPPEVDDALQTAAATRPDILSLQRQVDRAEAEVQSQMAQAFPDLSVQLGYTYQRQTPIGSPDVSSYGAALTVGLPLFNRNQGNIAKAQSAARQARLALEAGRLQLRADIEKATTALRVAYLGVTADDPANLKLATRVRTSIETAYRDGGRPLLDLLDAERAYRDAFRQHIALNLDYRRAVAALNTAVGKQVVP